MSLSLTITGSRDSDCGGFTGDRGTGVILTRREVLAIVCLFHRMKHTESIRSRAITEPIVIPAIAPPESLSPSLGLMGKEERELPINDIRENLARLDGIEPVNLLNETLNSVSSNRLFNSGIDPTNWLFSKCRAFNSVRLLNSGDIWPEKLLPERSIRTRLFKEKRVAGIWPENWLSFKTRVVRSVHEDKSEGSGPERELWRRLRERRWVRFPMELGGSWPESLSAGRRREVTRLVVMLQVTPSHEQWVGDERFQRRVEPRTAELRRRRAVLSSKVPAGRKESKRGERRRRRR